MPDTVNTPPVAPAPVAPTPVGTPTPPAPPAPVATPPQPQVVRIGDQEFTHEQAKQLVAAAQIAVKLDTQMEQLLHPDTNEEARQRVLSEIIAERYGVEAAQQFGQPDPEELPDDISEPANPRPRRQPMSQVEQELNTVKQQLQQLQEQQGSATREKLEQTLTEQIQQAVASSELKKMLDFVGKNQGEEKAKAMRSSIEATLRMQSKAILSGMTSKMGRFQPDWIPQAATEAAKAVLDQYRPVIEVVPGLGRAPETDAGYEAFLASKPVEPPKEPAVGKEQDAISQLRAFAVDSLRRGIAETAGKNTV